METFSKVIPHLLNKGPFRRKGVDNYVKWINGLPQDRVIVDVPMLHAIEKMGYHVEESPASLFDISQMWDALSLYTEGPNLTPKQLLQNPDYRRAHNIAYSVFAKKDTDVYLQPLKHELEFFEAIENTSSAGIPYFQKKLTAFPIAWSRYLDILSGKKGPNPCLAQFRTQRNNKTRLVWAYPMDMTLAEAKFARPLMERFKVGRFPVPWGKFRYEIGARLFSTLNRKYNVALDYSKFDSSISTGMILLAFGILKTWFKEEDLDSWDEVVRYFISTPIVMTDGNLYVGKRKGVPSGSYFTNIIDSIVNFTLIMYLSNKNSLNIDKDRVHIMGDDSVFTINSNIDLNLFSNQLNELGIRLNVGKSQVTPSDQPVHFIGFNWLYGRHTKPLVEILTSAVYPERFRKFENRETHVNELLYAMTMLNPHFRFDVSRYLGFAQYNDMLRKGTRLSDKRQTMSGYLDYARKYVFSKDKTVWPNVITGVLQ